MIWTYFTSYCAFKLHFLILQDCSWQTAANSRLSKSSSADIAKFPPMLIEMQVISSVRLHENIYVIGIATKKVNGSSQVQVYSLSEMKWSMLPEAPNHNAPMAVINGRITLIGGRAAGSNLITNIVCTWFEEEGKWKQILPPMPATRLASGVCLHDNLLLVSGGVIGSARDPEEGEVVSTAFAFDVTTMQWSTHELLKLPICLRSHHLVFSEGYVYLMGGALGFQVDDGQRAFNPYAWRAQWSDVKEAVEQDPFQPWPGKSAWVPIASPPAQRSTIISCRNSLISVGGIMDGSRTPQKYIYRFDEKNACNPWVEVGSMSAGRYRHAVVPVGTLSTTFLIAGGYMRSMPSEDEDNVKSSSVELVIL